MFDERPTSTDQYNSHKQNGSFDSKIVLILQSEIEIEI